MAASNTNTNSPYFDNEHFTVDKDAGTVVIKKYYFPFGVPKTIKLGDIEFVTQDNPSCTILFYKSWGMSLSPIWWALGMRGALRGGYSAEHRNLIIKVKGDSLMKGFSAGPDGMEKGLQALKDCGLEFRENYSSPA